MIFVLLLLFHVIGDFYILPKRMSENKSKNVWCLVSHALIIGLTYMVLSLVFIGDYEFSISFYLIVSHFFIDFITSGFFFKLMKKENLVKYTKSIWVFIIDQLCHIAILVLISLSVMGKYDLSNKVISLIGVDIEINGMILLLLFAILIYKPTKVYVEKVLMFAGVEEKMATDKQSTIIGYAERTIFFVSILANVPIVISFVIGMKTWAQSEKLKSKDNPFVGTFLIGSLTSLAVTIVLGYFYLYLYSVL